jgi:hypothetical protein
MTPERLREVLSYDPQTGEFRWRIPLSRKLKVGKVAGRVTDQSYITIRIDGRDYLAHRLAWLYVTGEWPAKQIDLRNRNRSDIRWSNLREATNAQNQANSRDRRTLSRGVDWVPGRNRFRARIKAAGRSFFLGYFRTEQQASRAYRSAARRTFGEFAAV